MSQGAHSGVVEVGGTLTLTLNPGVWRCIRIAVPWQAKIYLKLVFVPVCERLLIVSGSLIPIVLIT